MIDFERIKRNTQAIGMDTFIEYYYVLRDKDLTEIKEIFKKNERWKETSINTKSSVGKGVFKNNEEKSTLEFILSSRPQRRTLEEASEIYQREFPGETPKKMIFIKPQFTFGEEIVETLFSGYTIEPQKEVVVRGERFLIDWYIPELKIAIELDEKYHDRRIKEDKRRQSLIEEKLKCKFLRYKHK